jgi:hypothetical protein
MVTLDFPRSAEIDQNLDSRVAAVSPIPIFFYYRTVLLECKGLALSKEGNFLGTYFCLSLEVRRDAVSVAF